MPSSASGRRCGSGGGFGLGLGRRIGALFAHKSAGPVKKNGADGSSRRDAERREEDFDHLSLENIAALRGGVSQSPSQYSLRKLSSDSSEHEIEARSSPVSASTIEEQMMVWQKNAMENFRKNLLSKQTCRGLLKRYKELLKAHGSDYGSTKSTRYIVEMCMEEYGPEFDKVRWFERED